LVDCNLYEHRELNKFKDDLIALIEKTIFFDDGSKLRKGIKINTFKSGAKYVGEMFCGKRDGVGIFYSGKGDVYVGKFEMD